LRFHLCLGILEARAHFLLKLCVGFDDALDILVFAQLVVLHVPHQINVLELVLNEHLVENASAHLHGHHLDLLRWLPCGLLLQLDISLGLQLELLTVDLLDLLHWLGHGSVRLVRLTDFQLHFLNKLLRILRLLEQSFE